MARKKQAGAIGSFLQKIGIGGRSKKRDDARESGPPVDLAPTKGRTAPAKPEWVEYASKYELGRAPAKALLRQLVEAGASEASIRSGAQGVDVTCKAEGESLALATLDPDTAKALMTVLKLTAGVNPSERRKPQQGFFTAAVGNSKWNVRLQSAGSSTGEKLTLRLRNEKEATRKLEELGLTDKQLEQLKAVLSKPAGLTIVGGPPESGRSATLQACMAAIDPFLHEIVLVEQTSDRRFDTVHQIELDAPDAPSMADALKTVRRAKQPDVLLADEITNDAQSAAQLLDFAGEEHRAVGVLRGKDALSILSKLLEMKLDLQALGGALQAVTAQRLVRRLCDACKEQFQPGADSLRRAGLSSARAGAMYRPGTPDPETQVVCAQCGGRGYVGQTAIFETLFVTDPVRELIAAGANSSQIRTSAKASGALIGFPEAALRLGMAGATSLQEIGKVLSDNKG